MINFLIWNIYLYLICCCHLGLLEMPEILEMLLAIKVCPQFWAKHMGETYEAWHSDTGLPPFGHDFGMEWCNIGYVCLDPMYC